jgi:tetratricopeptide (TPR) repeat protein
MIKYIIYFIFIVQLYANSIKGDIAFEQQNYIEAIKYYKLVDIKDDKYINIKLAQSYVRLADNFSKIKNYDKAIKLYKKAIKLKSKIAKIKLFGIYEKKGDLYFRNKKYQNAIYFYTKSSNKKKINKINKILNHQKNLINDTRKTVSQKSPIWTHSIGRLIIPTQLEFITKKRYRTKYKKCSATLVNINKSDSSRVIITASHCLTSYKKKAGNLRFIIKDKNNNNMIQRLVTIYKDSKYNNKKLNTKSDYAILILDKSIDHKNVDAMIIDNKDFMRLKKENKISYGSMAGFSSDVGGYGNVLTYDPKCELSYYSKTYAKSNCKGFKGSSGGPVVMTTQNKNKYLQYHFVGVISHFRNNNFKNIYFAPHHIFYNELKQAILQY